MRRSKTNKMDFFIKGERNSTLGISIRRARTKALNSAARYSLAHRQPAAPSDAARCLVGSSTITLVLQPALRFTPTEITSAWEAVSLPKATSAAWFGWFQRVRVFIWNTIWMDSMAQWSQKLSYSLYRTNFWPCLSPWSARGAAFPVRYSFGMVRVFKPFGYISPLAFIHNIRLLYPRKEYNSWR